MARASSLREEFLFKSLSQQAEIFFSGDASRLEVVSTDRNRYLGVGWNHDGPANTGPVIRAVTTFLPNELKPSREKDFFKGFPVDWRDSGHG